MRVLSSHRSAPSAAAASRLIRRPDSAAVQPGKRLEPMLPALLRSVMFFATLATPFVVALLIR